MTTRTTSLFPDYDAQVLAALERRLDKQAWLKVSDVALATDLSVQAIYANIECGNFHAVNFGASEEKPFLKVTRQSIVDFYKRRLGIED